MSDRIRIAVIPGDGIGKEVMPEGMRVLEAAGSKYGLAFDWDRNTAWLSTGRSTTGPAKPISGPAA